MNNKVEPTEPWPVPPDQKQYTEEELLTEIARLKEFKEELIDLVGRFGHDSNGYCGWDEGKRDKMSAKEWADIVYKAANDTMEWEKSGLLHRALEKIKE